MTPTSNGCWNYYRPIVTTGTFQTCSVNPYPTTEHYYGNGTDKIYDDTNTSHTSPTDSSAIGTCLSNTPSANNLYMEFMAASGNWFHVSPPNGGAVTYYSAELFSCDSCRDSLSAPSNDVPTVNINPDEGSQSALTSDIQSQCFAYSPYATIVLYADTPVSSTVQSWINSALDGCFR